MDILCQHLKELRGKSSQAEFTRFLGLSGQQTYQRYEDGKTTPNAEILHRIATRCEVSVDWLLGLSDKKTLQFEKSTAADRLTKSSTIEILTVSVPHIGEMAMLDMAKICCDSGNVQGLKLIVDELVRRLKKERGET